MKAMRWHNHLTINLYWLGLNIATGSITPVLLPYLVALFVPQEVKNTSLATIRVVGLAVAMMIQPMAGMLSDRSRSRWGRRRPFIVAGTVLNVFFLLVVGASPLFLGSELDGFFLAVFGVTTAFAILLVGIVLVQMSSNLAQGGLLGLIPDLVPEDQRGRASGVKAVFELVPVFLVIFIGPLVDAGRIWLVIGIITAALLLTMLGTLVFVQEKPLEQRPAGSVRELLLRLVALAAIFVFVSQAALRLVRSAGEVLGRQGATTAAQVGVVGLAGLIAMAGSIFLGVYLGAWVGIGKGAPKQRGFIWWVVNRLLFLAAVGSIQGFAQFYLSDVLGFENAASMTTILLAVVALFLIPSALGGGYLADRLGRRKLVIYAGILAAAGTALLVASSSFAMVIVSGCIIGTGAGLFMSTSWALGTDLAPSQEAGRYLGISNLAGAGAGIVGAGIGGPMADFFNRLQPGLGYIVIFAIYGMLFLLSALVMRVVPEPPRLGKSS